MKIAEKLKENKRAISFEVFPPKQNAAFEPIVSAVDKLCALKPSFISVTYGAGGGANQNTLPIAKRILENGVTPLAHLTCLTSTREKIQDELYALRMAGVENILALRGDVPLGVENPGCYSHASDLASVISEVGGFSIGGACYPECHPECEHLSDDIDNLKKKVDAGVEFLTTQMFFDNNIFYRYLAKVRERGITVPVVAGIMPVTNGKQIKRICQLSGTYLPSRFKMIVDKFGDNPSSMFSAGLAYATEQIIDLFANGVNAVHVYTMNKPEIGAGIMHNLGSIVEA